MLKNFSWEKRLELAVLSSSVDELAELADDPHPDIRLTVALNPNISEEIRAKLEHDPDLVVRRVARGEWG